MDDRWMSRAACKDADPNLFQPRGEGDHIPKGQLERARAVCRPCPVRRQCLRYALDNPRLTTSGVWGGSTLSEREAYRKAAKAAKAREKAGEVAYG
ncbi:WhiB family transcriptional regulator [Thermomonospora cellulosilytica]|nr:WhiB family transcriptional regulator [Thermomonospora cellulosilytica]